RHCLRAAPCPRARCKARAPWEYISVSLSPLGPQGGRMDAATGCQHRDVLSAGQDFGADQA
ncbi:MAG: hypothetical protein WD609_03565, partial [Aquisalimonadaceae bacterium]